MFQFPRFAFVSYLFRHKYLLVISAIPKLTLRFLRMIASKKSYNFLGPCENPASIGSKLQRSKVGFPIRKSADQSLFAAPHGLSQRTTSFFASQRQGIHRIPLRHLIALIIDAHRSAAARHLFRNDDGVD